MIKVLAMALLIVSSSFIGMKAARKLGQRVELLYLVNDMLEEILINIRFRALTVGELMKLLSIQEHFNQLGFIKIVEQGIEYGGVFSDIWSRSIREWEGAGVLHEDDKMFLINVGQCLGNSDIDGQISITQLEKEQLKRLIVKAAAECEKKSKLYRYLGILSGVFISIMMV